MRKLLFIVICLVFSLQAQGSHIIGGQVFYRFLSKTGNTASYQVTLKLYRICESGERIAEMPPAIYLASFDKKDNSFVSSYLINRSGFEVKTLAQIDPCIINPPRVCFQVGTYETIINLPVNAEGYTISFQSCCRDAFMVNILSDPIPGSNDRGTGATYFTEIPGTNAIATGHNSSPAFNKEEATLVCADKKFTYDFSASDPDADSLSYEFCDAYKGGQLTDQSGIPPVSVSPPYNFVSYNNPFNGQSPLGPKVKIDPRTGIISGIAPAAGKYVVTVCVNEFRNGVKIGTLRKDFHVNVTSCVKLVNAAMPEKYADCSSLTITFLNTSTDGKPYFWDFGDGTTLLTNSKAPLQHTYTREGTYKVILYVDKDSNCGDSAIATAFVYPRFDPEFTSAGACMQRPTTFIPDITRIDRGSVEYYHWDFGNGDTTNVKSPQYQYKAPGTYNVQLFLRSTVGCEKTIAHPVTIYDKPPFLAIGDTLLCFRDSLQMWAQSNLPGTFKWSPDNYRILNPTTPNPVVFPRQDTSYTVVFTDRQQCTNEKTVHIDVKDTILVHTIDDSTVCTGDEIHLRSQADDKYAFRWRHISSNTVISNTADALVTPAPPQQSYEIKATLGRCQSADTVTLRVVDPPRPTAAPDTTICFGTPVTLRATGGAYYRWSPSFYIDQPSSAVTIAHPPDTTLYTVTVTDTLGCPKPVTASALVRVVPKVPAFAGNDTIVMLHQPFQLQASGGIRFDWTPSDGLNRTDVFNPVTTANKDITYTVTAYTKEGCSGKDDIFVRFIKGPGIYIPNAFSPNGDGMNDIFRPVPVGIVKIDYFRVYDRWGKLMYSTTSYMKGWDGYINGLPANLGTYVWVVQGQDINNQTVQQKGTVTLVR
ncbi:PKD domain-containing protein [Chitinophaga solisilvae]|uniref:PKD domain-containing protein n=1 Tax=Chitinophaga solisilvae TaxID=1233460 RepID=UPI00136A22FA|nr:gliding motility-associated C-terminal domain-containing protein [Chitinophaga solisilvae]